MRKIIAAIVVGTCVLAIAGTAGAHPTRAHRLRFQTSDTGSAQWQSHRSDSPSDANAGRLKLSVSEQTGDDYAVAWANGTGLRGKNVDRIRNLSFEVRDAGYVGAGAPRISVEVDTNGDGAADVYAYLSALYCMEPIGTSGWSRADFTGRTSLGCAFYTSEPVAPYASTGTEDAWTAFANAHAGAQVLDAYVVMDEVGSAFLDRIALGRHMFVRGGSGAGSIKSCPFEVSC